MARGFSLPQEEIRELQSRVYWLFAIIATLFLSLLLRSWYLQAVQGDYYKGLSENNRVRVIPIDAPRGLIYARFGELLIKNIPSFNLYLVLEDLPVQDREAVLKRLSGYINIPSEEIENQLVSYKGDPYTPIKIKQDLTLQEVALIESHRLDLPGTRIESESKRNALHGALAVHLLGYVGEVSSRQLEENIFPGVKVGGIVGQYGSEKSFDAIVRGTPGKKGVEVDALGHEVRVLKKVAPVHGNDLYLTLEFNTQKAAEEALGASRGAIVALDPNNGEILAMVSHPAFDPNLFFSHTSREDWKKLIEDPDHPLTNRVIQGQYPPGSIFKIVMAAAGLETETISQGHEISCRGGLRFGKRFYRDWKRGGHGTTNLHKAIVESCDVYFYHLGRQLGIDTIADYAHIFGLGRPTGIDLDSEKGGIVPNRDWKLRTRDEIWYPGETLSVSIGQGFLTVTPLQMATVVGALVTGTYYRPQILKEIRDTETGQMVSYEKPEGRPIPITENTRTAIRLALIGTVSETKGTGGAARSELVSIGGKTGTAQVVRIRRNVPKDEQNDKKKSNKLGDHAWFVSYAPVEKPRIVVSVIVENGGHGGKTAAPLAKKVIEAYISRLDSQDLVQQKLVGVPVQMGHLSGG